MKQMEKRRQDRNKSKPKPEYMKSYGYYYTAYEAIKRSEELGVTWTQVKRANNRWKKFCVCEFIQPTDSRPKAKQRKNKNKKGKIKCGVQTESEYEDELNKGYSQDRI